MPGIVSPPPPPSPPAPAVVLSEMPAGDVPNNASAAELSWGQQIKRWFNLNFVMPARSLEKVDLGSAILLGFWFGIFPIPGTSTALLGAFLVMFRRSRWTKWCPNAPQSTIALGVNLLCTPLCIGLIPLWLRLGALVSPPRFAGCDPDSIVSAIKASNGFLAVLRALQAFASCMGLCIIVYLAFTPVVAVVWWLMLRPQGSARLPVLRPESRE
ncbi:hypothetical protein FOZ61_004961 [Perkinsus olseni]|uniref:Uncharacterized protein n=1 Tax=Perkinsus olseni TaxID=32597 RepID=A0A7J6MC56_PEROL|nr:hypothetical protein FOZ61_004961 [Perkinsus olseni]